MMSKNSIIELWWNHLYDIHRTTKYTAKYTA